ncbi:hypothetical protein FRC02_006932 [Tulasnella sp. 418]|nr:hypothetical protein FRC02_006932 [Tulasnella sp. 418]
MREPSISSVPPSYPPSLNNHLPPTYNPHPLPAEQSLLAGAVPPPEGVLSFSSKHFAVALTGQPESDNSQEHVPEYGRNGVVQGAVEMIFDGGFKSNEVAKIRLKIEGKLKLEIAEGGTHSAVFLDQDISLYPKDDTDAQCPSILPFAYALPTTYHEDQPHAPGDPAPPPIKRPLPPSYECEFDGVPGLRAQVRYMIRVEVTRKKIWKRKYCLPIKFLYKPRSRPHLPGPPPNASFLATLKQSPEEWAVFSNAVPRRNDPTNLPGVPPLPLEQILQQEGETILSSVSCQNVFS